MAKLSNMMTIIFGAIAIIIGVVLLPVLAGFTYGASYDHHATKHGGNWTADTNITGVSGLPALIDLVLYGFTFGLVGLGVSLIYVGFKGMKKR